MGKYFRSLSIPLFPLLIFLFLFVPKPFAEGEDLYGCCPKSAGDELTDQYDPTQNSGEYLGTQVIAPPITNSLAYVLGDSTGSKRIEVDLTNQKVYAYDGTAKVFEFLVSTGKWAPTPKGSFTIERKIRAQTMKGGNKAIGTYYYLPNVPWVMFFGNRQIPWYRGFSFHGTYWHNNFGHPMSHGCINMKTPEAEQLYSWAPVGTLVNIY